MHGQQSIKRVIQSLYRIQTCTMLHPEDCASDINRCENFKPQMNSVQE